MHTPPRDVSWLNKLRCQRDPCILFLRLLCSRQALFDTNMFNKIKKGVGEVKASADIETDYLMSKNKNNFDHPAENGVRIKAYQDSFQAADDFLDRVKSWVDKYQDIISSELKMIEKMNSSAKVEALTPILTTFTSAQQNVVSMKQQHLGKVIEYIQSPGKKFISDQAPIRSKIDQTNKAWVELRYWRKKGGSHAADEKEAQLAYDAHLEQLFKMLDQNVDSQLAQWVKYFADFQVEFFTNAAGVAPRV